MPLARFGEPHMRERWDPPEEEPAAVEAVLDGGGFDIRIASVDEIPFACVPDGDPAEDEARLVDPPASARAVDLLVGPPSHLGRGLVVAFPTAFAEQAAARGATGLPLHPDACSRRALAACARAGFAELGRRRDGGCETVVPYPPIA